MAQQYLEKEPLYNIYLIHGLETYGLNSNHASFFGAFHKSRLGGVLFTDSLTADLQSGVRFGCLAGTDQEALAKLGRHALKTGVAFLKGKSDCVQAAADALAGRAQSLRVTHWNLYRATPRQMPAHYDHPVHIATTEDVPALIELYKDFEYGGEDLDQIECEIQNAILHSGCFFVALDGRPVSATMIVAETDRAGMLNYTRTLPQFRGQGLHLSVRTACYDYLFQQGKVGLGVYSEDNAAMNNIANKYGAVIGKWSIAYLTPKPLLRRRLLPLFLRELMVSLRDKISGRWRQDAARKDVS